MKCWMKILNVVLVALIAVPAHAQLPPSVGICTDETAADLIEAKTDQDEGDTGSFKIDTNAERHAN